MVIIESNSAMFMGEETEPVALNMTTRNLEGSCSSSNSSKGSNSFGQSPMGTRNLLQSLSQQSIKLEWNSNGNGVDDELTNLTWLQDNNLLKNMQVGSCNINETSPPVSAARLETSPLSDSVEDSLENLEDFEEEEDDFMSSRKLADLPHIAYDPMVHVGAKPPYSFSCLIFMAIEDSPIKALPVKEIYSWILRHFPYYQNAAVGWKNSIRHNLSLNKCFSKVKGHNIGKGSLWCTDPEFRPNLLHALRKSPYCSFTQLDDVKKMSGGHKNKDQLKSSSPAQHNVPSPCLFPYLSQRLTFSGVKAYEVDAAATMLALKNTPPDDSLKGDPKLKGKKRKRKLYLRLGNAPLTNCKPSKPNTEESGTEGGVMSPTGEDHNYSSACFDLPTDHEEVVVSSVILEEEEPLNLIHINNNNNTNKEGNSSCSEDEEPNRKAKKVRQLDKEDRSLEEGAQALLSLANIAKIRQQSSKLLEQKRTVVKHSFSDR